MVRSMSCIFVSSGLGCDVVELEFAGSLSGKALSLLFLSPIVPGTSTVCWVPQQWQVTSIGIGAAGA